MAVHGKDGIVEVGANAVAQVRSFEFNEEAALTPTPSMGAAAVPHLAGQVVVTGTITCWWDGTDTTGQGSLVAGAEVSLTLQPEGVGAGKAQRTFLAKVGQVGESVPVDGGIETTFNFGGAETSLPDKTPQT